MTAPHHPPTRLRCALVAGAATVALGALAIALLPTTTASTRDFDEALVRGCAVLALGAAGWLWLGTVRVVLAARGGRGEHAPGLPAPVRRLVLAGCGVALAHGLALGGAQATPGQPHEGGAPTPVARVAVHAVQDRPAPITVVVRPGDSLWSIAERSLGPAATDARTDARWREIYELNRTAIGADPDLIQPAQRLRLPVSEVLP